MKKSVLLALMMFFSGFARAAIPAVAITTPEDQGTFTAGSSITMTATASEADGAISSVAFYNGPTLLGKSSKSPYSCAWDQVPAGTYALTAVATDIDKVSTTSSAVTVTVTSAPPVIDIVSPANDTTLTAGSSINLTVTASEFNGSVSTVKFYNGPTLLGESSRSPYSYVWANVPAGDYTLTAVATDTNKISTTSSPVTITVTSSPVMAIISPDNDSAFTAGSNITITASASENNGTIREVYFYDGTYYLGSTTKSPYTYTWTHVPAGAYSLTVEATDSSGGDLVSTPIDITVNPAVNLVTTPSPGAQKKNKTKS